MPDRTTFSHWLTPISRATADSPKRATQFVSVGEKADYVVDDFTDLLLFTFPDGSTYRLEFEEENWVTEGSGRLHVEGLSQLRALLDKLLGDQIQK